MVLFEYSGPISGESPSLLAVFAHPDDETFAAGGTLALHAQSGWAVRAVCATHGEAGSAGRGELGENAYKILRVSELRDAALALGVEEVTLLDWGDGRVEGQDPKVSIDVLEAIMLRLTPAAVVTFGPEGISGHPDHLAISRLTRLAFDRYRHLQAREGALPSLYYVVPSAATPPCCGKRGRAEAKLPVTTRIDISSAWPAKLAAMRAYRSQRHLLEALQRDPEAWVARVELFFRAFPGVRVVPQARPCPCSATGSRK